MSGEPIWVHPKGEEAPGQNTEPKQIRELSQPRKENAMNFEDKNRKKGRKKGRGHKR